MTLQFKGGVINLQTRGPIFPPVIGSMLTLAWQGSRVKFMGFELVLGLRGGDSPTNSSQLTTSTGPFDINSFFLISDSL